MTLPNLTLWRSLGWNTATTTAALLPVLDSSARADKWSLTPRAACTVTKLASLGVTFVSLLDGAHPLWRRWPGQ